MVLVLKCHVRTEETDVRLFLAASDPIVAVPEGDAPPEGMETLRSRCCQPVAMPWLGGTVSQLPVLPWLCWLPWPKSGAVWFLQASWLLWPSRWSGSRGWANEKGGLHGPALTLLKPLTSVIQTPILLLGLSQTWWFLLNTMGCLVVNA